MQASSIFTSRPIAKGILIAGCAAITLIGVGLALHPDGAFAGWWHGGSTQSAAGENLLKGTWKYLPGATAQADGLHIQHLGRTLVNQDGSGGQANPPVNLYGTRLDARGPFTMTASVRDIKGSAMLSFYERPPVIQDEFRVEPASIQLIITRDKLTVQLQHGTDVMHQEETDLANQTPAFSHTYSIKPSDEQAISLTRSSRQFTLTANGKTLGAIDNKRILGSGQVWVGTDAAADGSWTLAELQASAGRGGTVKAIDTIQEQGAGPTKGLQAQVAAKRPDFKIGAAMALEPIVSDTGYQQAAFGSGTFGAMTTENALKRQFIEPARGHYDFKEADALIDLAAKHHLSVHGHTLVFGEANPPWVANLPTASEADKAEVKKVMVDHVSRTMGHFKGKISSWDVVNEPLADYDDENPGEDGLRQHKWYQAMGEGYITTAFQAARQADPNARLFINEYGLEQDGERWENFLALMRRLKDQGVPVDGVGFQAHVYEASDQIDPVVLRQHIQALANLGLVSRISEMDVYDEDGPAVQATQYRDVFNACLAEPSCVAWTTWGISDRYDMFQDDDHSLQYGHDLLWDTSLQPTEAYRSLITSQR